VAINPTALANINAGLMPAQVTGPIFAKASESRPSCRWLARPALRERADQHPRPMDLPVPDWVV
jgi:hypothetical protein